MKFFRHVVCTIALVMSLYGISGAAQIGPDQQFVGVKTGTMFSDYSGTDDIIPLGVVYGYSLNRLLPNLWVEGEFNYGVLGGKNIDVWTLAAYGAYRFPLNEKFYLKGKAGLLYENVKYEYDVPWLYLTPVPHTGTRTVSDTETEINPSVGVGAGLNINEFLMVEAEATIIEEDINYLSVGLNFKF